MADEQHTLASGPGRLELAAHERLDRGADAGVVALVARDVRELRANHRIREPAEQRHRVAYDAREQVETMRPRRDRALVGSRRRLGQ